MKENPQIVVSFKHLDLHSNPKFSTSHCESGYVIKLLERLRALNQTELRSFRIPGNALRSHEINFSETTEPGGFTSLNPQLRGCEPWQCQITSNEHGRLHGILIDDTFYIVWIDPCHLLYSQNDWCGVHQKLS